MKNAKDFEMHCMNKLQELNKTFAKTPSGLESIRKINFCPCNKNLSSWLLFMLDLSINSL